MVRAYSRLSDVLQARNLTVSELRRRLHDAGTTVNPKSLYRLGNTGRPLRRLDLPLAGAICATLSLPLSELIAFESGSEKLRRLSAAKQKRLDQLMRKNNDGELNSVERNELQVLVREAEEITLHNARRLAAQREQLSVG